MSSDVVTFAVVAISQFFSESIKGAAKKIGESAGEKIYALLNKKFEKGSYESQTLERLKQEPNSKAKQEILKDVLEEVTRHDVRLLKSLAEIQARSSLQEKENIISIKQNAHHVDGNVIQIGGNVVNTSLNNSNEKE